MINIFLASFFLSTLDPALHENVSTLPEPQVVAFIDGLNEAYKFHSQAEDVTPLKAELIAAKILARTAGYKILEVRSCGDLQISEKEEWLFIKKRIDITPLTIADLRSNVIICQGLKLLFPDYAILSEEGDPTLVESDENKPWYTKKRVFVIDPLDGTKEFIKGLDEYGVHIALIEEGRPILGVTHFPATNTTYWGVKGQGAYRQIGDGEIVRLNIDPAEDDGSIKALISRNNPPVEYKEIYRQIFQSDSGEESAFNAFFDHKNKEGQDIIQIGSNHFRKIGSAGLKMCQIIEGLGNCWLFRGNSKYWDTASTDIILTEAGGMITDWQGKPIIYLPIRDIDGEILNPGSELIQGVVVTRYSRILTQALQAIQSLTP